MGNLTPSSLNSYVQTYAGAKLRTFDKTVTTTFTAYKRYYGDDMRITETNQINPPASGPGAGYLEFNYGVTSYTYTQSPPALKSDGRLRNFSWTSASALVSNPGGATYNYANLAGAKMMRATHETFATHTQNIGQRFEYTGAADSLYNNYIDGGVSSGSVITAQDIVDTLEDVVQRTVDLIEGRITNRSMNVRICHVSCHTSCHSSRGRR